MYVLENLWREGLSPNERYTRKGSEYHMALLKLCEEEDKVCQELTDKGRACFEAFRQAQMDLLIISEKEMFIEAFRLGARLMVDVLGEYHGDFEAANKE